MSNEDYWADQRYEDALCRKRRAERTGSQATRFIALAEKAVQTFYGTSKKEPATPEQIALRRQRKAENLEKRRAEQRAAAQEAETRAQDPNTQFPHLRGTYEIAARVLRGIADEDE